MQLESMSDIASSDLFNTVQVLQSWCFKRNSNRIYSGRKDWPGDSPTTRFAFLLAILMETAILYAWCFFLCRSKCVPLNSSNSTVLLPSGPRMRAQHWGAEAVCRWCWQQHESEDGGADFSTTHQKVMAWQCTLAPKISWCTSGTHQACSSLVCNVNSRSLYKLQRQVGKCMGEKFTRGSARQRESQAGAAEEQHLSA